MIKRKVTEVVEEYNDSGKLIRKTTTETTEDDDTPTSTNPYYPLWSYPTPTVQYIGDTADSHPLHECAISCHANNGA